MHCQACTNEKYKIVTKIPVEHVCPKFKKGRKAKGLIPETKHLTGIYYPEGTYYKIFILQEVGRTNKATKYKLAVQYINNSLVSSGTEDWFPNSKTIVGETLMTEKYIWIHEEIYKQKIYV